MSDEQQPKQTWKERNFPEVYNREPKVPMAPQKKFRITMLVIAAATFVVVLVSSIVVVNVVQQQASQAAYERCLESYGFTRENVRTYDDLDALAMAAESCSD